MQLMRYAILFMLLTTPVTWHSLADAANGFIITEEMQGVAGADKTVRKVTYVTDSAVRIDEDDKTIILELKGQTLKLYEINTRLKTLQDSSEMAPMFLMGYLFFLECADNGRCKARNDFITPTSETRVVGKWKARKLIVQTMGLKSSGWYTKDSKEMISADRMRMKLFAKANETFLKSEGVNPGNLNSLIMDFSEKIIAEYGAAVMNESAFGGITVSSAVVSAESRDIPYQLFTLPTGYRVIRE